MTSVYLSMIDYCCIFILCSMHNQGQFIILEYLEKVVASIVDVTITWLLFQHLSG